MIFILSVSLYYIYFSVDYYQQILNKSNIRDYTRWILSDKYIAKRYAELNGFEIPKTYQISKYPHNLIFNKKNFVLKPLDLCDSDGIYLVKNNINIKTNEEFKPKMVINELQKLRSEIYDEHYMHTGMYNGLIPYSGYMIEELLLDENNNIPSDLKCYVFGGKLYYIAMTYNRKTENNKQTFDSIWFDRNWNPIKYKMIKKGYKFNNYINKPKNYDKMIYLVENMAKKLNRHCRIDIYNINGKIYLGEFTFFCGARLHTLMCNLKLGALWKKYPDDYKYQDEILPKLVPEYYNKV